MASRNEVFKLTIDVDAEIKNARAAAESLQKSFSKINLSDSIRNNLNKTFSNLEKELTNFETMTSKPFKNMGDVQKAEKSFENITNLFDQLKVTAKNVQGMDLEKILPKDFVRQLDRVKDLYKTVTREAIEAGKEQQKAASNAKKAIADQNKELKELQKTQKELEGRQQQHQSDRELLSGNYKGRAAALKGNVTKAQNQVEATKEGTVARDIAESEVKNAQKIYNDYIKSIVEAQQREKEWANTHKETETKLKEVNSAIDQANEKIKEQEAIMNAAAESPASLEKLREALSAISGQDLSQIPTDLKDINEMVATLQADKMHEVAEQVEVLASEAKKADAPLKVIKEDIEGVHNSGEQLDETASEVERLGDRIRYFFSIGNSIRLFKRAIHDAMNTVKELDKAMTETATVTDFSISDMWEQLPKYTAEANKLGTSINSLYKATTLYYQQGLDTNEAMALGVETIKMARVAGMDAAQATDLMTAALRGFNMELNETSAVRVNDVYSELAAVTAADTDEIGIAISKTASIAHSANMEFETTAAFLSQIIETTREAPETAGTAMKTIVARFSEVKKLYSEGQITGTDEEGEVVNVNKIQEALRTVGIDMSKFFTGKEGLDQVLLRLAEKWDTLDVVTQRYIATQAAGSRQQSRFLAMMSDYDRTLELVDAAYNSAGSGQQQFEKTLDSMEAKLAELKNAWDQFTMGIANSEFLKAGIDFLTDILGTINDIISALSGDSGLAKSIISLGASFLTLRTGAKLLSGEKGNFFTGLLGFTKGKNNITKEVEKKAEETGEKIPVKVEEGAKKNESKVNKYFSSLSNNLAKQAAENFQTHFSKYTANLTEDQQKEINIIYKSEGAEAAIQKLKELGITIDEDTLKAAQLADQMKADHFRAVGNTISMLGMGLNLLGSAISKTDKKAGNIISTFGTLATVGGQVVSNWENIKTTLSGVAEKLGTSLKGLGVAALYVAGVLLVLQAAWQLGPNGQLKRAEKEAAEAQEAAREAQQAFDDLLSDRNNYNDLEEKISSLTEGTQEWKDAVAELNDKVLELITNYEGLELDIDQETGRLKITEESWDKVQEQRNTEARNKTSVALAKNINKSNKKYNKAKADRDLEIGRLENEHNELTGEMESGAASGEHIDHTKRINEINKEIEALKKSTSVALENASKQIETDRRNLIKYLMPDSIDSKEVNNAASAISQLIGGSLDKETDPEKIQKKFDTAFDVFDLLSPEQQALLAGNWGAITSENVSIDTEGLFTDEQIKAIKDNTGKDIEDILAYAKDKYDQELSATNGILQKYGINSINDTKFLKDQQTGFDLKDRINAILGSDPENAGIIAQKEAQAYVESWKKIASQYSDLAADLLKIDIKDIRGLNNVIQLMRQAGVSEEEIKDYWEKATAGANNFQIKLLDILNTAKAAQEQLKGISELGERMDKGTMTDEDVQQYLAHGGNMDNLMWTAEGWKLVGESAEEAMKRERAAILQEQETELQVLKERQEKLKNVQTNDEKAQILGINKSDFTNENGVFETLEDYEAYLEAIKKAEEELPQEIETQVKVVAGVSAIQNTADQNALAGKGPEAVRQAVMQEATNAGLDTEELIAYSEQLQKIPDLSQEMADRIALDNMKMNASVKELSSNWEDWSKALQGEKNTAEYSTALHNLQKNMKSMLGISSDLSEGFLTDAENMELMAKAAEGDGEAIDELRKAASKDIAMSLGIDENTASEIQNVVSDFIDSADYENLKIGAEFDNSSLEASFQEMLESGALTVEQMNAILEGIGWQPQVTYAEMPLSEVESFTGKQTNDVLVPDGEGGYTTQTITQTQTGGMSGDQMVRVPILGSQAVQAKAKGYNVGTMASFKGKGDSIVNSSNKGSGKGKGGGGGGSKKQNNWKNPYDKYYNLTEKINEALRTREKIEHDYDRILKRRERTAAELLKNSAQEIANLRQEIQYQKRLQAGRREQIQNVGSERYDNGDKITTFEKMGVTKYAGYNFNTQTIEIDWAAIEAVRDEELGKAIEAYVSRLEELQGQYEETQDTIEEMEDNIWEINQRGKEEYLSFEQRVLDALIAADQKIIDDLSAKFEGINSANDKILNSMQEQIDLERQIRDNTKTEDDIAQKEARLAYLRRDTSGANATEIMKLEQELADARQNYTDTLIDQGMQKLSDENQRAAEQRQEQIDIMQSIHDWTVESGGFNQKAEELINEAATAGEVTEAIKTLLQDNEGWTSMTKFAGEKWMTDLANEYKAAMEGMSNFKVDEAKTKNTSSKNTLAVTDANGKNQQNVWFDSSKNRWVDSKGNLYDIYYDPKANNGQGGYKYSNKSAAQDENAWLKEYLDSIAGSIGNLGNSSGGSGSGSSGSNVNTGKPNPPKKYYRAQIKDGTTVLWTGTKKQSTPENAEKEGREYLAKMRKEAYEAYEREFSPSSKAYFREILAKWNRGRAFSIAYKTGGLADFTGPAWLDGTKAHPELVLNARDTENFIQLKDILSGMGSLDKLQNGGDNYYNFDIKVDQLASDYDVDKLIGKIKNEITKDAVYRNTNAIHLIR